MDSEKIYTPEEIVALLKTARIEIVPRDKNMAFIYRSASTLEDVMSCIRSIEVRHFYKGPLDDDNPNRKGKLYIFKKMFLDRYWVYIKCTIKLDSVNNEFVVIVSFHENEEIE